MRRLSLKKNLLHYPPDKFQEQPDEWKNDTHFSDYDGYQLVGGIRKNKLGSAKYLGRGLRAFNPGRPDRPDLRQLPISPPQPVFKQATWQVSVPTRS